MKYKSSIYELSEKIKKKIKENAYGNAGERFLTTRKLAEEQDISLVSAQKLMDILKECRFIELIGKKYYLTHKTVLPSSPLGKTKTPTKLIGMHISNIRSPFFSNLAREVEINVKKSGYMLIMSSSSYKSEEEENALEMFRKIGVDGVISCPGVNQTGSSFYESYSVPFIFLGKAISNVKADRVLVNNYPVAYKIAKHFANIGCETFVYVGLEEVSDNDDIRLSGFREGINNRGFSLKKENIIRVKAESFEKLVPHIKAMLTRKKGKVGIFCYHDLLAFRVLDICKMMKYKVPDDIAIAGFDNLPGTENTSPQLTTVSYRTEEMAKMAVFLLLEMINNPREVNNANYYIEPTLLIRGSTRKQEEKYTNKPKLSDITYIK